MQTRPEDEHLAVLDPISEMKHLSREELERVTMGLLAIYCHPLSLGPIVSEGYKNGSFMESITEYGRPCIETFHKWMDHLNDTVISKKKAAAGN